MRILHLIPTMGSGGSERQLAYLATEQVRQRHIVDVAHVHEGANLARLVQGGAYAHRLAARGNHDPALWLRIVRLIRQRRPDIVQTWLTQMDVLGGLAALSCRVPWVLSERSSALGFPPTLKNCVRSRLGGHAAAVAANSTGGLDYWRARVGRRVVLREIPNSLPIDEIAATAPADDGEIGLASGDRLIIVVGRLDSEKNLPVLIDALAIAAKQSAFVVRICGEGDAPSLQRQIDALGLGPRIALVGYVERVWGWMKRATLFVSLSRFEGRPNAVFEAAVAGCPLVLSDIPAHREAFDTDAARFVRGDDRQRVAEAIIETLAQDGARAARAARARNRAAALSPSDIEQRYMRLYREILSRREVAA